MSTTFKPFGLKPVYHPSGLDRAVPFVGTNSYITGTADFSAPYSITAGQAFYQYQPVKLVSASGGTALGIADATAQTSPANNVYGVFDGVEFTDSQGRRSVAKWISYEALAASTQIVFWIFQDPALVYEVQANGSVDATAIGKQFNFDTTAGSTTASGTSIGVGGAGFSTTAINPTAVGGTDAVGQVRVVGLGREVAFPTGELNAWGDDFTIVQVQIANNAFVATRAAL